MLSVHCDFPGEELEPSIFPRLFAVDSLFTTANPADPVFQGIHSDIAFLTNEASTLRWQKWMNQKNQPGHQQEPWQQVKIPVATAGSAAKQLLHWIQFSSLSRPAGPHLPSRHQLPGCLLYPSPEPSRRAHSPLRFYVSILQKCWLQRLPPSDNPKNLGPWPFYCPTFYMIT